MNKLKFICKNCNNVFYRTNSYVRDKHRKGFEIKYCSHKCHLEACGRKDSVKTKCSLCSKKIIKTYPDFIKSKYHFCSRSCSVSFHNKTNPKRKKILYLKCKKCGNIFERGTSDSHKKVCKVCAKESLERFKNFTLGEYKKYIKSRNLRYCRVSDRIRYLNRSWNKNLLTNVCQYCEYDKHADLSHKKFISMFKDNAKLSEINSPDNNLVLCPNHHWEYDHKLLSYDEIIGKEKLLLSPGRTKVL